MKFSERLEQYRLRAGSPMPSPPHATYGAFFLPGPCGRLLRVIACDGREPESDGWEHVSVSIDGHIPIWIEMAFVKDLFWSADECVVQFHPPKSQHVNIHPNCLHLWRSTKHAFPMPSLALV